MHRSPHQEAKIGYCQTSTSDEASAEESDETQSDPGPPGSVIKMGMNTKELFSVSEKRVAKPSKNDIQRAKLRKQHSRLRGIPSNRDVFFCPVETCQV